MPEQLSFDEFQSFPEKEWKQLIQFDLKGADYNELLVWQSLEGIKVQPFYHRDSFEYLDIPMPEDDFSPAMYVYLAKIDIAGRIGRTHLEKGAETVEFTVDKPFRPAELMYHYHSLDKEHAVHFKLSFPGEHILEQLTEYKEKHHIRVYMDNTGHLVRTGNWWEGGTDGFDKMNKLNSRFTGMFSPLVDASHYHNAGANMVQQLALALAHGWEYINRIDGLEHLRFHFALGSNYFFEIAKLRAFRYLWQLVTRTHSLSPRIEITAMPGIRNKTLYDPYVNMLRTTSEVMSAILGGADRVFNIPFDTFYARANDFSSRIARNQLAILKEENRFKGARHFATGSYYIEKITLELAKKSLEMFQKIEAGGGLVEGLKNGSIQDAVQRAAAKEQQYFDEGKIILVGTNKYPDENEKIKDKLELYPFVKFNKRRTLIRPLIPKRLAEKTEQERINRENPS